MKLKYFFPIIITAVLFSCDKTKVTDTKDYSTFLNAEFNVSNLNSNVKKIQQRTRKKICRQYHDVSVPIALLLLLARSASPC